MKNIQLIEVDYSIIEYYLLEKDYYHAEGVEFRNERIKEFKKQIEKSLNVRCKNKKIKWCNELAR